MSNIWNPDEELARCIAAEELARARRRRSWPEGATAGVLVVALCCIALGTALYQFAGPRQVVDSASRR